MMNHDKCQPPARRWATVAEVADYLGISRKGCYDMIAAGKIPAAHIGRLVRVDFKKLDQQLEGQIDEVKGPGRTSSWRPGS